jgi:glycosyltransferase involved in cell wall biosynthesis
MKKNNLFIVDLESIPTRYTASWKTLIPDLFRERNVYDVYVVEGEEINNDTSAGGFLNFVNTNKYKASQIDTLAQLIAGKRIQDGDVILFTDAWHYGVIALKYMLDLQGIKAKIAGFWHAGSYSKNDPLDQANMGVWAEDFEVSLAKAIDFNLFATVYHLNDFVAKRGNFDINKKVFWTGFPYDFEDIICTPKLEWNERDNVVVFPHRDSKERNPWIIEYLQTRLKDFKVVKSLDVTNTRQEYLDLLAHSKFCISHSDNENWGISMFEASALGCIPIVNDAFSYVEMYPEKYRCRYLTDYVKKISNFTEEEVPKYQIVDRIMRKYCDGITEMHMIFKGNK